MSDEERRRAIDRDRSRVVTRAEHSRENRAHTPAVQEDGGPRDPRICVRCDQPALRSCGYCSDHTCTAPTATGPRCWSPTLRGSSHGLCGFHLWRSRDMLVSYSMTGRIGVES